MKTICKLTIAPLLSIAASAQDTATNSDTQTNLVSDIPGMGTFTGAHLINPRGLCRTATSYWWAADTGTGVSTLYDGAGTPQTLVVTVPPASGTVPGKPTGTVVVGGKFIFVTLDGTISQWTSGTHAIVKVNNSGSGAAYTGCTTAKNGSLQTIYVANSAGGVEAYTTALGRITLAAGAFQDPAVSAGYTPYGIQAVGKKIYVTFAAGPGAGGFVDAFDSNGTLLLSFAQGKFNQPRALGFILRGRQRTIGFEKFALFRRCIDNYLHGLFRAITAN